MRVEEAFRSEAKLLLGELRGVQAGLHARIANGETLTQDEENFQAQMRGIFEVGPVVPYTLDDGKATTIGGKNYIDSPLPVVTPKVDDGTPAVVKTKRRAAKKRELQWPDVKPAVKSKTGVLQPCGGKWAPGGAPEVESDESLSPCGCADEGEGAERRIVGGVAVMTDGQGRVWTSIAGQAVLVDEDGMVVSGPSRYVGKKLRAAKHMANPQESAPVSRPGVPMRKVQLNEVIRVVRRAVFGERLSTRRA